MQQKHRCLKATVTLGLSAVIALGGIGVPALADTGGMGEEPLSAESAPATTNDKPATTNDAPAPEATPAAEQPMGEEGAPAESTAADATAREDEAADELSVQGEANIYNEWYSKGGRSIPINVDSNTVTRTSNYIYNGKANRHVYRMELPASGRVTFKGNFYVKARVFINIYDIDGNQCGTHLGGYGGSETRNYQLDKYVDLNYGTYYLVIQATDGSEGNYSFTTKFELANETYSETLYGYDNDSMANASTVGIGAPITGFLAANEKTDYYKFFVPQSGRVRFSGSFNIHNTYIYIYDAEGNRVDQIGGIANSQTGIYKLDKSLDLIRGNYYMCVEKTSGYTGFYNFRLTHTESGEYNESQDGPRNNDMYSATALTMNKAFAGQIAENDDVDYYSFTVSSRRTIYITGTFNMTSEYVYLYDADGNRVAGDMGGRANSQTGKFELSKSMTLDAGTYYLCVKRYSGNTGNYTIKVSDQAPKANNNTNTNTNTNSNTGSNSGSSGSSRTSSSSSSFRAFPDVPAGTWYYSVVGKASSLKLINGYKNGNFGPNDRVTRGQVAVILWNMAGNPGVRGSARSFPDVYSGKYYYEAVRWASSVGVVNGYKNGRFGPNDLVTREQLASMLASYARNVAHRNTSGSAANFSFMYDSYRVSSWAASSVGWCFSVNIISGSSGYINPQGNATRAETAKMVVFLHDLL